MFNCVGYFYNTWPFLLVNLHYMVDTASDVIVMIGCYFVV
jgi:hypothetical protein